MKLRIVSVWVCALLAAAVASAQSKGVKINLDDPSSNSTTNNSTTSKTDPKAAPKTDTKSDAKKKDAKKADEMGKIEGIEIPRGAGFMGIQLVDGTFKLSFYNAKKKPVAPDADHANLRWNVKTQSLPERTVLNSDGKALTSPKIVKPPYTFSLSITLVKGEGETATTENFTVDFHS